MKNKISVQIDKPINTVFKFTTNPKNTPLWIDAIKTEETSDWPIGLRTAYKNKNKDGHWSEYRVVAIEPNKLFELTSQDGNYHVRYSYEEIGKSTTEMEYLGWVDEGKIDNPFTQDVLDKLKAIIEKQ